MNDRLDVMREALGAMNQGSPHARHLGIETISIGPEGSLLRAPYKPEMVGDPDTGVIAGGVVTALLDHACGQAVHTALERFTTIATLDLRMDYLRPALGGLELHCRAAAFRVTPHIVFARASVWQEDERKPVALSQLAFMRSSTSNRRVV